MSDYHKCARCGVADVDVLTKRNIGWVHSGHGITPDPCIAALQRELARRDELLRECPIAFARIQAAFKVIDGLKDEYGWDDKAMYGDPKWEAAQIESEDAWDAWQQYLRRIEEGLK